MKAVGGILIAIGVGLALYALSLDVSIPSYTGISGLPERVVNIQLLQNQSMMFNGGIALFVAGILAIGLGRIEDAIRPQSELSSAQPSPEVESSTDTNGDGIYVLVGVAIIAILMVVAAIAYNRNSGPTPNSGTSDAENLIDQANSDLENAQRAADELLRQTTEALGE